ncbi:hypothetical protein HHI36_008256 [Cryptolaemus montrouzieri]|uniref:Uncharacterized protein n=1 Tax=Cryptolaemus montrouzieri TaxID=559131 RepID=A0ABD2MSU0_9CUCU
MMVVVQEGKRLCTFQEDARNFVITRHLSMCRLTAFIFSSTVAHPSELPLRPTSGT